MAIKAENVNCLVLQHTMIEKKVPFSYKFEIIVNINIIIYKQTHKNFVTDMIIYTIGDLDDHGETIHTASVENHVFFLPDHMVKHKGYLLGFKFKADASGTPKFQASKNIFTACISIIVANGMGHTCINVLRSDLANYVYTASL